MAYIRPTQDAHWYTADGKPCHVVPNVKGGGLRKTTMRDARKLHLLPSVTSILKVYPRPNLEAWKSEQLLISALTTPRIPGEGDKELVTRILLSAGEHAHRAARVGSLVHRDLHRYWKNGWAPRTPQGKRAAADIGAWIRGKDWVVQGSELTVADSDAGYAGTVDLWGHDFVADYKFRAKPAVYITDCVQLWAYRAAMKQWAAALVSLIGDPVTGEIAKFHIWTPDDEARARVIWSACFCLWRDLKGWA